MDITTLGIDLAKNVFHLYGIDSTGKQIVNKQLSRSKLMEYMHRLQPCSVAMESCGGAHYFARRFKEMGHEVRLIAPQFVKGFLMGEKNDKNDAKAICCARGHAAMRYVPIKTLNQQDIQSLHRHRELLIKQRTQQANQIRGLLAEYGQIIPEGLRYVRSRLLLILSESDTELSELSKGLFRQMYDRIIELDAQIKKYDNQLLSIAQTNPACKQLLSIPGIGPKTATALYASVGFAHEFKNGRQFAAWCGLVPKQNSSGGKTQLGGINKRGNRHLRTLLVHEARSIMRYAPQSDEPLARWAIRKYERSSFNKTVIAVANKNARVAWTMLSNGVCYDSALVCTLRNG